MQTVVAFGARHTDAKSIFRLGACCFLQPVAYREKLESSSLEMCQIMGSGQPHFHKLICAGLNNEIVVNLPTPSLFIEMYLLKLVPWLIITCRNVLFTLHSPAYSVLCSIMQAT